MSEWTEDGLEADLMILRSMVGQYAGNEEFDAFGRVYRVAAAAPTMAEALENLLAHTEGVTLPAAAHVMREKARAALTLAKGEDRNG
jgi:hypothetical protein